MSEPVRKTLAVFRHLSALDGRETTSARVAEACAVPAATLSRILGTMTGEGLVRRPTKRSILPVFTLEEHGVLGPGLRHAVRAALEAIADETAQSAELVALRGDRLTWEEKVEHPDLAITIKAQRGFTRGVAELDCLSRLVGAIAGWEALERLVPDGGFYAVGQARRPVSRDDARAIVRGTDPARVQHDIEGNRQGVRRFTARLRVGSGVPLVLAIAEPALGRANLRDHVARNDAILARHVRSLEATFKSDDHREERP